MDSGTAEERRLDGWERRLARLLVVLPYPSLAASVLLAGVTGATSRPLLYDLALSAAACGWLLLRGAMDRRGVGDRPELSVPHFAVLILLISWLVLASPVYGFFAWSGYVHAMRYLRGRWRIAGVGITTLPTSLSQIGGALPTTPGSLMAYMVALGFNVTVVGLLLTLNEVTDQQSRRRKAANAALSEANERLAAMLAENAGLHAQLISQAREAGVMDERQRMAREIHDTVAQGLAGIVTQLQAAAQAREHGGTPQAQQRHLDNAARLARDSLTEARRAVQALRPEPLEQAGLPTALTEAVDNWRQLNCISVELTVTGTARPLHPEVEITLLRAAQEALANVAKHAAASRVGLTLSYMEDVVTLDVRDDGSGFDPLLIPADPGADAPGGFGLTAMRQRIARLAGRLEIESEPGGGTAVFAAVPAVPGGGLDD